MIRQLIVFILVSVLYSESYTYFFNYKIINILPGHILLATFFLGLFILLLGLVDRSDYINTTEYGRQQLHKNVFKMFVWFAFYIISISLSYALINPQEVVTRTLKSAFITCVLFILFILMMGKSSIVKSARIAIVFVMLLSVILNYYDFIIPDIKTLSASPGRAAGFYVNPNNSGFYLVLGMIVSASLIPVRYRVIYCFTIGSAVLLTFSRSSIIAWFVSIFLLAQYRFFNLNKYLFSFFILFIVAFFIMLQFGAITLDDKSIENTLSEDAKTRIVYQEDNSVKGRIEAAKQGYELLMQAPLFGHGLGSHLVGKTAVNPHNQYLLIGSEQGFIGIIIYLWLFFIVYQFKIPEAKIFTVALFILSFFTHNVFDYLPTWLLFSILTGMTIDSKKT